MTLTFDTEQARQEADGLLRSLARSPQDQLDAGVRGVEKFLATLYAVAAYVAFSEPSRVKTAELWRQMLDICDACARLVQELARQHPGAIASFNGILDHRNAAREMFELHR